MASGPLAILVRSCRLSSRTAQFQFSLVNLVPNRPVACRAQEKPRREAGAKERTLLGDGRRWGPLFFLVVIGLNLLLLLHGGLLPMLVSQTLPDPCHF